ncbi:MAG: hypothetical protein DRP92_07720 [Candidatus Neomarinimicrobiota bacterium]|nr:MAG: hypothetical protein DRP92_07720 [Candidatus Neomarinimicrobiota bacterium]
MTLEKFERDIREVFSERFLESCKSLKEDNVIFNPLFYLFFTRLVELNIIKDARGIEFITKDFLRDLFKGRRITLQIDYFVLLDIFIEIEKWNLKGKPYSILDHMHDILYVIYRIDEVQKKIDEMLLDYIEYFDVEYLYYSLIKIILEIDDEVCRGSGFGSCRIPANSIKRNGRDRKHNTEKSKGYTITIQRRRRNTRLKKTRKTQKKL